MSEQELLNEIEGFASVHMSLNEVRKILGIDPNDWTQKHQLHYEIGWLRAEASLWETISETALRGSAPAQVLMVKRIQDQKLQNLNG